MTYISKFTLLLSMALFLTEVQLQAHPGGTNKQGCHKKKSTGQKHCHNGVDRPKLSSKKKKKSSTTKKSKASSSKKSVKKSSSSKKSKAKKSTSKKTSKKKSSKKSKSKK